MSLKDDFLVDLEEEILTEAAHNLFSRRVRLEREVEAFSRAATKVRKQMDRTLQIADTVHRVVMEPERLYTALGVEPKGLLRKDPRSNPVGPLEVPFRFTRKGRYAALAEALYDELAAETEKYNHGELYKDPETTLMKRTAHYEELMEWHMELNSHIVTENKNRPSYSLRLAKSLNTDVCEKEKAMEPCIWGNNGCHLDERLAFKGVPFSCTGLVQVPVLPPAREIKTRLHSFLEEIYDHHSGKIHELLFQKGPDSYAPGSTNR
ncbi:MAG: hypothetical protein SWQ30_10140 [Thermodesulfobacteriota bacterium]|nr:hypothetical protein [Thermodesulfobacteriota bacterium]